MWMVHGRERGWKIILMRWWKIYICGVASGVGAKNECACSTVIAFVYYGICLELIQLTDSMRRKYVES